MRKLPIGISDFKELIKGNYTYVDKTKYIYKLINEGKYYFLSRPRRFGKSLLLSTIRYLFEGKKELFKGLYIEDKWNWEDIYPVIRISFAKDIKNKKELKKLLNEELEDNYEKNNIEISKEEKDVVYRLKKLIKNINKKYEKKVAILVDEYDKPILDVIENKEEAEQVKKELKAFYSVLKDLDEYIKFVLVTGVSKFSKVSLFSGLNQLEDISLNKEYGNICGYTQQELEYYFKDYLEGIDKEEIKEWYNGYSFLSDRLYNPFDVLLYLKNKRLRSYWYETGTPGFLIKLIKEKQYNISRLEGLRVNNSLLSRFDIEEMEIEALMYQTGYLTIREEYNTEYGEEYIVGFPNKEVKISFNRNILNEMINGRESLDEIFYRVRGVFLKEEIEKLKEELEILISNISYMYLREESNYVVAFFSMLYSSGLNVITEDNTHKGRIDLTVIVNKSIVYIMEFKVIAKEDEIGKALHQIKDKEYYKKYMNYPKIYLIGIEFHKNTKKLVNFEYQKIK